MSEATSESDRCEAVGTGPGPSMVDVALRGRSPRGGAGAVLVGEGGEAEGVADGGAAWVVVEVGVGVVRAADLCGPGLECLVVVVRPGVCRALVEAQVEPAGGAPEGRLGAAEAVGPAQGGAVLFQDVAGLVRPPGGVAGFDGDADAVGEAVQAGGEAVGVGAQCGRELEQDGAEGGAQAAAAFMRRSTGSSGSLRRFMWVR